MCLLTKLLVVSILTTGIYARAQYIDDRVKKYEEQVRAHPQSAEAWYKLGEADLLSFGKTKARTAFEKAIELKPDYAEAYNGLGLWYQNPSGCGNLIVPKEFYEKAIELHQQAIRFKPNYSDAYAALGNAYSRIMLYENAVNAYRTAIKLNPNDKSSHHSLGEAYEKLERYEEAIEILRIVIAQNENYRLHNKETLEYHVGNYYLYSACHKLGSVYLKLGRYKDAIETYQKIVLLGMDSAETHYGLGLTHIGLGDKQSAEKEYKILKSLKKGSFPAMKSIIIKNAQDLRERIEKLP